MSANQPRIISLSKILDKRGNLTFIQSNDQIPFKIKRVFWTYDVPGGATRGGHAYFKQRELIIALSGSFDVVVKQPEGRVETFHLNRSYFGLFLPPEIWRHMENFSTNSLALHLSNSAYTKGDYIRDFKEFQALS